MITLGLAMVATMAIAMRWRPIARRTPVAPPPPRRRKSSDDWAAFLDTAAGDVRGGQSLRAAFDHAKARHAPHGRAITAGTPLAALVTARTTDADEAVAVRAFATAMHLGGAVAAGLQAAAALVRERAAVRADALSHAAQARLSARVLTAVPIAFFAWSTVASASFRATVGTGAGVVAVCAGLLCNLVGWWWMRRLIDGASR